MSKVIEKNNKLKTLKIEGVASFAIYDDHALKYLFSVNSHVVLNL
jgi:hypothetical protein